MLEHRSEKPVPRPDAGWTPVFGLDHARTSVRPAPSSDVKFPHARADRHPRRRSCHSPDPLRDFRPGRDHGPTGRASSSCPRTWNPARVYALGNGLHAADGVSLIPMSAKLDLRQGSDATMLIFRRGSIDAALMDANPKLKLIQRIGARADAIDLAAAAQRSILVSCVPRATLQLTAEHAILLALALAKRSARGRRRRAQGPLGPRPRPPGPQRRLQLGRHRRHRRAVRQDLRHCRARRGRLARRRHGARLRHARALLQSQPVAGRAGAKARRRIRADRPPARGVRFRLAARDQHSGEPRPDRRRDLRRDEEKRVLHQHRARTDRGRRRALRCADQGHHRGRGPRRAYDRAAPGAGPPRDAAERNPDAAHCGRLAQGRDAGNRRDSRAIAAPCWPACRSSIR